MQRFIFCIVVFSISVANAQRWIERDDGSFYSNSVGETGDTVATLLSKPSGWAGQRGRARIGADVSVQVPNLLASGVQIVKQAPYVEILKLIEAFVKLKGDMAGRIWALINDNAHIWAALRDTFIKQISSVHNLTLNAIVIIRKIMEFARTLFSNFNVNIGSAGSLFSGGITLG